MVSPETENKIDILVTYKFGPRTQLRVTHREERFGTTDFQKITHSIEYVRASRGRPLELYITKGGELILNWSYNNNSLESIESFYWRYKTKEPLIIGLTIKSSTSYYKCTGYIDGSSFDKLPAGSIEKSCLVEELYKVNNETNKTIKVKTLKTNRKFNVKELSEDSTTIFGFSSITFIPNPGKEANRFRLSADQMFKAGTYESKNKMDSETLGHFKDKFYNNITTYYPKCTKGALTNSHAILVELVKDGVKTHIRRVGLKGEKQWEKVETPPICYNNYDQLCACLNKIQLGLINPVTVNVDRRSTYLSGCSTITVKSEPYSDCIDFEKVTQKIEHECPNKCVYCVDLCRSKATPRRYYFTNPLKIVDLFFSKYNGKYPLIVGFTEEDNGATKYYKYKNLETTAPSDSLPGSSFTNDSLKSSLFQANEELNAKIRFTSTNTTEDSVKKLYGYVGTFSFTSFVPKVNGGPPTGGCTLSKDQLFRSGTEGKNNIDDEITNEINNRQFSNINVYYPTTADGIVSHDHAILIEFADNCKKTHIRRISVKDERQWELVKTPSMSYSSSVELCRILKAILYGLNNNVVVLLDRQDNYTRSEVEGPTRSPPKDAQPATISVTRQSVSGTSYLYYKHEISLDTSASLFGINQNAKKHLTIELDLYIGNVKITLKDGKDAIVQHVYYREGSNNWLYVYFYGKDPRPLLLFYDSCAYRPNNLNDYNSKWVRVDGLSVTESPNSFWFIQLIQNMARTLILTPLLLKTLKEVCDFMNPVKIDKKVTMSSVKHIKTRTISFWTEITVTPTDNNCYTKVTHTAITGYRLGNITHGEEPITDESQTPISAGDYSEASVFYKEEDTNYKYPLLITLKKYNGPISQPCYELTTSREKVYKKYYITSTSDEVVIPILDRINLSVLNKLIIILENQQLYNPQLSPALTTSQSDSSDNHQLKVSKHDCPSLLLSSFKCYKHEVTKYSKISDVGGLKFQLWDEKETQPFYINGKQEFTYTKCKGDVCVFFHGDDPRPLLFCYNKSTYKPESKQEYEKKWVKVDGLSLTDCITSCTNNKLLIKTLEEVCDFMNAVQINPSFFNTPGNHSLTKAIKLWMETSKTLTASKCYLKFIYTANPGYRLGNIMYESKCVKLEGTEQPISAGDYSQVSVFYKTEDPNYKYPLLIVMKKENNSEYRPYYELTPKVEKVYKKIDKTIDLEEKTLLPILDHINYAVNKCLRVILSEQRDYIPDLMSNIDRPPPPPPPKPPPSHTLQVVQNTPTPILGTPYICYTHKLSTFNDVNDIGGLKLGIYNGNELKILSSDGHELRLTYTKCKGDLQVYFYLKINSSTTGGTTGSSNASTGCTPDTVPLAFYFNGKWYSPNTKDDYFKEWTEDVKTRGVTSPIYYLGEYKPKVMGLLDKINRMLNRVELQRAHDYGIPAITGMKTSYAIKRVMVSKVKSKSKVNSFYLGYTHSTINKGSIGDIYLNDQATTTDIKATDYEYSGFNNVTAFFLLLDNRHLYPLLICLGQGTDYNLYYELKRITTSIYNYKKHTEKINLNDDKEMEKKLVDILSNLSDEDKEKVLKLFLRDDERYYKELEALRGLLSFDLMKTIIPVGPVYTVAGLSIYPLSSFIHSSLALI